MKKFIKEWWTYVALFLFMMVTNYLNAITSNGTSWVWTLNGAVLSTTAWHALQEVAARYEVNRKFKA